MKKDKEAQRRKLFWSRLKQGAAFLRVGKKDPLTIKMIDVENWIKERYLSGETTDEEMMDEESKIREIAMILLKEE
jgi:hypothetical protein